MWSTTSTTQEETSTQAKRFACDRCHDQKLRCTRPQENEPCVRCAKAGVVCNVSAAQRTGRPRKSSGPRHGGSEKGRKSPPTQYTNEIVPDGGASDNGSSKGSELVRAQSSESRQLSISPSLRQTPDFSTHMAGWDTFASSSGSSISSLSIAPPEYSQPISTEDYADLLDCITDQSYFDSMDISEFPDCMQLDPTDFLQNSLADLDGIATYLPNMQAEPNPKKRKSNGHGAPYYTNQMSLSPPILDAQASARISSFQEMDMPIMTPGFNSSDIGTPDLGMIHQSEQGHVQTLAKLQSEIDVCSERIMQQARRMHTPSSSYTTESQKLSEALGVLLSTAERFIELISCICRTFDTITTSTSTTSSRTASPSGSPWNSPFTPPAQMELQQSYFSNKMYTSNNTTPGSLDPNLLTGNRQLSTSTFYTMLKCHVRLLSAYDTTLDTMSSRLLELENLDAVQSLTSALSIGSFVVPYGAIIETLLHLQVISHQLDRLKTALHGNLLKIQPQRSGPIPNTRSLPARLGLCKQGQNRSPSVSMVDFKLEEIQERERALQTKLLRIEALAESSKQGQIDGGSFQQWM
ncbi:uncharacterized protein LY89DRAFT_673497 [Mollisia scopiformis]|uniref:Zn(2)-C6 fungal-type domain-containing protein n=1 Tax=Mollisia scopiformis TaxID=149040 RepID=A0A194WX83_MOLSC|nr:uncharacterized protein LY89DRAFT_673497 [Mollisia scopiformis]KUJ12535.1 hypothetical protein LY89DRAFT_673497 [Mollisia scopiformis]